MCLCVCHKPVRALAFSSTHHEDSTVPDFCGGGCPGLQLIPVVLALQPSFAHLAECLPGTTVLEALA